MQTGSAAISPFAEHASGAAKVPMPWHVGVLVAAVFAGAIGGPWDISWHMTIGRDTFWTPAHLAIYLGGATAGFVCGWLAIRATFLTPAGERSGAVRCWGGRAPFGAWVVIWGAIAMLTAGPFDDWWHNAYGLDVKIISPPHVLLFLGGVAARLGAWLLVLREQNRTGRAAPAWLFCIVAGLLIEELSVIFTAEFWPNREHESSYFLVTALAYPGLLVAISRATRLRWGTTIAAASYMLFVGGLIWILPLFAAEPKLGPIYHHVSHMVPPPFPQWLIVPAFAIDAVRARIGTGPGLRPALLFAIAVGFLFVALFLPTQWVFSEFYLSPAADNWFFGGNRIWGYVSSPAGTPVLSEFWGDETTWSWLWVARAFVAATATAFLGRQFGNWMNEVKR